MDLLQVTDVYENENIVVMEAEYAFDNSKISTVDIGVKDQDGDIEKIITVDSKISA